jgi:hypothetical protein
MTLIFYADEDSRTLDILRKHLFTLDIIPDKVALHASRIESHLQQVKEERLFIILVSVDSLVIFKEQMETLTQTREQRYRRFGLTGIISVVRVLGAKPFLKRQGYVQTRTMRRSQSVER